MSQPLLTWDFLVLRPTAAQPSCTQQANLQHNAAHQSRFKRGLRQKAGNHEEERELAQPLMSTRTPGSYKLWHRCLHSCLSLQRNRRLQRREWGTRQCIQWGRRQRLHWPIWANFDGLSSSRVPKTESRSWPLCLSSLAPGTSNHSNDRKRTRMDSSLAKWMLQLSSREQSSDAQEEP